MRGKRCAQVRTVAKVSDESTGVGSESERRSTSEREHEGGVTAEGYRGKCGLRWELHGLDYGRIRIDCGVG